MTTRTQRNIIVSAKQALAVAAHVNARIAIRRAALTVCAAMSFAATSNAIAQPLPRAKPEEVGLSSDSLARIAPMLQRMIDSGRIAGAVAAVARHGKIVYMQSVGTMDSARKIPMRDDAVFRIYSMTKPITTVAFMQFQERGTFHLDDLPYFSKGFFHSMVYASGPSDHPTLVPATRHVTFADLLTHTSGLTYGVFGNSPVDSIYRRATLITPSRTLEQFSDSVAQLPLLAQPGTKWNYSVGVDVIGRAVERITNEPLDKYFKNEIFDQIGMRETAFHATPAMNGRVVELFAAAGPQLRATPTALDPMYTDQGKMFAGGQGLLSTVSDYMIFAQMLLNGGQMNGKRILKPETVSLMMQNHLPPELTPIPAMRGYGFGYGGAVQVDSGPNLPASVGTFRWSGYASTYFWIDPKQDLIGMVWTQVVPTMSGLESPFQRIVYSSITDRNGATNAPDKARNQSSFSASAMPTTSPRQQDMAPVNDLPNPYATVEGWAKLESGRSWGSTSAVDIDKDGKSIWVAERCGANACTGSKVNPIMKFNSAGMAVMSFGGGMFATPHGIYVDKDNNVWVTDCSCTSRTPVDPNAKPSGHQIYKFNSSGKLLMTLGKAGGGKGTEYFYQPNDILVAPNGDIYVVDGHSSVDSANARLFKFDKTGNLITMMGGKKGTGTGEFDQPHALAMDSKGRLFVADRGNNRILIYDQSLKLLDTWYQFSRASGLFIDKNDMLYSADSESGSVNKAHGAWKRGIRIGSVKDGKVLYFIPDPAENPPSTSAAEGVAVDAAGHIYGAEVGPKALKRYEKK